MIVKQAPSDLIRIHCDSPEGNAFNILILAQTLSKAMRIDFKPIHDEMTKGDYENLIQVFDKHFGDYVLIYK